MAKVTGSGRAKSLTFGDAFKEPGSLSEFVPWFRIIEASDWRLVLGYDGQYSSERVELYRSPGFVMVVRTVSNGLLGLSRTAVYVCSEGDRFVVRTDESEWSTSISFQFEGWCRLVAVAEV